ncbi:MAG: Abi family protein [Bacillota bacterium]|nr:Abi family protein [Bacillota bacterium]
MRKKGFLTYDEQIAFLKEKKNLEVQDEEYAKKILFKTGYFPLINGYKETYKNPITSQFQDGITFEDIYELYQFDNDLRSIFIKYILMLERNIKSSLSYHFCLTYGDMQDDYLDINHYDYSGKKKIVLQNMLKIMKGQLRNDSDYVYIRHYMKKYNYVPLWVLFNVLTIGQLSKIYSCQKGRVQIQVCQDFGPIKINEMIKMLAVMTKFRNVCAHNDRLFDFRTKDALCDMKIYERLSIPRESGRYVYGKNDLFAQVIILKLLLPEDEFKTFFHELKVCFRKHPVHKAVMEKMGFPMTWEKIGRIKKFAKTKLK